MKKKFKCSDCEGIHPYGNYTKSKWGILEYHCTCCDKLCGKVKKQKKYTGKEEGMNRKVGTIEKLLYAQLFCWIIILIIFVVVGIWMCIQV